MHEQSAYPGMLVGGLWLLYTAIAIAAATAGMRLATARQRSAWGWAFLCLAFPPALGILFWLPPRGQENPTLL